MAVITVALDVGPFQLGKHVDPLKKHAIVTILM